ncbi:hypothetical protein JVT61DRAFT_7874 [Boletus reticuloceps]|uniref:Uncharacterized protein n=1 Tax=Boletus reticuloceps TaxID=495285 RepID=A0A8I2YHX2_9AGAM|nr:hypothetical protein JVT61DRAFT_7874 [Boletus reticuloceps]
MARASANKCTTLQGADEFDSAPQLNDPAPSSNIRKKAKMLPSNAGQACRLSRVNRGSGGQIAQLQNLEHIQTQTIARVTPMDVATANEPINPFALPSEPPKQKGHTGRKVLPFEMPTYISPISVPVSSNVLPGPTCQVSNPGSQYSFSVPSPAPGSTNSRGSSAVLPTSCGTSSVPSSALAAPTSHHDSVHNPLRSSSATSVSQSGSVAPMSRGFSAAPVSHGGAHTPSTITVPTSPVPLRALQIAHRSYNSQTRTLSRTFSIHDINAWSQAQQLSAPAPPPYNHHADEDGNTESDDDHDDITLQTTKFRSYHDPSIDEISPDEDERTAEAALHASGSPWNSYNMESQMEEHLHPHAPMLESE